MKHPIVKVDQPGRAPVYLAVVEPIEIGRECDGFVVLDEKVSRKHIRLSPAQSGVLVTDLGSTNGSFLDEERVVETATMTLGSVLRIGETAITLESPVTATNPGGASDRPTVGTIVATLERPLPSEWPVAGEATGRQPEIVANDVVRSNSIDRVVASLGDQVSLPHGRADETITIMFSDVEASTELAVRIGDQHWYEVLSRHNALIEHRVLAHGGYVVKTQGDGFMVTFSSARRAIICACEIQQALHLQAEQDPSTAVRVRIGLHTGEPIRQDSGDVLGRQVIVAARIGSVAEGGEVLVSSIVRELASARGDLMFENARVVELKGLGAQTVVPVRWNTEIPKV